MHGHTHFCMNLLKPLPSHLTQPDGWQRGEVKYSFVTDFLQPANVMKGTRKNQITQIHCDVNECGTSFIVRFKRMGRGYTFSTPAVTVILFQSKAIKICN